LVFINVNGQQFLLKEQDILIGEDELALSNSDFIEFPISVGPTGPAGPTGPTGPAGPQGEDGVSVVNDGISIDVTGSGTIEDPYTPNLLNLQKVVTSFPYTLSNNDDKHVVFLDNLKADVVVNIPNGLVNNFSATLVQKGEGEVELNNTGTATILYPSVEFENKIRGQHYYVDIEKEIATNNYYLLGDLKPYGDEDELILNSVTLDEGDDYILNYTLQFTAPSVKGWYKQNSSSLWLAATVVAQGSGAIGTDDLIVTIPITGSVNFKVTAVNPSIGTVVSSNVITQTIT
jgi:hypothetical protein